MPTQSWTRFHRNLDYIRRFLFLFFFICLVQFFDFLYVLTQIQVVCFVFFFSLIYFPPLVGVRFSPYCGVLGFYLFMGFLVLPSFIEVFLFVFFFSLATDRSRVEVPVDDVWNGRPPPPLLHPPLLIGGLLPFISKKCHIEESQS